MAEFPRPFLLHLRDGRTWAGAVFADGFTIVYHPDEPTQCMIAVSLRGLLDVQWDHYLHDAWVEWADGSSG